MTMTDGRIESTSGANSTTPDMQAQDDLKAFLIVLRQGLLLICAWIEKRYGLKPRG
jgi:hypothetical protein